MIEMAAGSVPGESGRQLVSLRGVISAGVETPCQQTPLNFDSVLGENFGHIDIGNYTVELFLARALTWARTDLRLE